jgi:hypothetical protein
MAPADLRNSRRSSTPLLLVGALVAMLACMQAPPPPKPTPKPSPVATSATPGTTAIRPADHVKDRKGALHKSGGKQAMQNCTPCHGADLRGDAGPSCYTCHNQKWK